MIYISSDNKIMICDYTKSSEIINDTGYIPICVYSNIILMSDHKLYVVTYSDIVLHMLGGYKITKIVLMSGEDYYVEPDNFTNKFVKINSECYKICDKTTSLIKLSIVSKRPHDIIESRVDNMVYNYVDINNNLIFFDEKKNLFKILDSNVDLIFYGVGLQCTRIIYKKINDTIVYSLYNSDILIHTNIINYEGQPIIKTIDLFSLDSGGVLHQFLPGEGYEYTITDISFRINYTISTIADFNIFFNRICVSDHNKCIYNTDNSSLKHIDNGYFRKVPSNTKSASNIYTNAIQ